MPKITLEEALYKTYILEDESTRSRVEIVPERGGIVTQWQVGEHHLFYLDKERFTDPKLSVRGGIPILFPICGNLPDDRYTHNDQPYTLKQHGFARSMPWTVVDQQTTPNASLSVSLTSDDTTLAVYPFEFEVVFTYVFKGNVLEIQQRYTNRSTQPMPFATGFHPYFAVQDKTQLKFDIPATQWQDKATQTNQPFSGSFDFTQDELDMAMRPISRQSATVVDMGRGLTLTLDYDTPFTTLVFWTVKGKDFYCLEPWSAPRNALNTGEDLQHLAPDASLQTSVRFTANFTP